MKNPIRPVKTFKLGGLEYKRHQPKYYQFVITMKKEFSEWAENATHRVVDALDRHHASDYTQGNVDYHVKANDFNGIKHIYGDVTLAAPKSYIPGSDAAYWKDIALDAVRETIKYELGPEARMLVESVKVTRHYPYVKRVK